MSVCQGEPRGANPAGCRHGFVVIASWGYSSSRDFGWSPHRKFMEERKMSRSKVSERKQQEIEELAHGWGELLAREVYPWPVLQLDDSTELVRAPTGRRYFSPGRSNMSKAKCCVALGTRTNEHIGRAARDPFSRSSPRPKWCGRSFRPRFSSLGENASGSADSPCGCPPRVPRRFAIALVAAPWATIGPPRLGLLGDFAARQEKHTRQTPARSTS